MNIILYLQELDDLILQHTKPPVTALLRNKLSLAMEQAEAHSAAVAKQEKTLARQLESYEQLANAKKAVEVKLLAAEAEIARRDSGDASMCSVLET
jgi:hypothetical protein